MVTELKIKVQFIHAAHVRDSHEPSASLSQVGEALGQAGGYFLVKKLRYE